MDQLTYKLMTSKMLKMAKLLVHRPKKQMCYQPTDQPMARHSDLTSDFENDLNDLENDLNDL